MAVDDSTDPTVQLRARIRRQLDPNVDQTLDPSTLDRTTPTTSAPLDPSTPVSKAGPVATAPLTPPAPAASDTAPLAPTSGWDANRVREYYTSHGVTPFATSPDYWAAKWNEWGKNDEAYFLKRLGQADEFTGKGPNYDWQAAGQPDPGTKAAPSTTAAPSLSTPSTSGVGATTDPNISAFFAQQVEAKRQQQARDAEIRAIIKSRLAAAGEPVDENAANITAPLSAARDEVQRSQDRERIALAERLYATGGLNTGSLNQAIQQSSEHNAGSLSRLRAGLITHEADAKRQELESLLQLATASGDSESARTIQAQLGAINAFLTQQGQGINLAEFGAQLNQNAALAGLHG